MKTIAEKQNSNIRSKTSTHLLTLFIALSTVLISFFFVNTSDDYYGTFGTTKGAAEIFKQIVYFGNGRFIGNFQSEYLTHRFYMNLGVRALYIFLFIVLLAVLADGYKKMALVFSAVLTFGMTKYIFREAVVWVHGFYNYFPPVVLLLLSLVLIKYYKKESKLSALITISMIPLGICQQLHSENTTMINLVIAVLLVVFTLYRKENKAPVFSYAASSFIGCAIMFLAPRLLGVSDKMESYRGSIADGKYSLIGQLWSNIFYLSRIICSMYVLWIMLAILLMTKLYKNRDKFSSKARALIFAGLSLSLLLPCFIELSYSYFYMQEDRKTLFFWFIGAAAFALYIIALVVSVWKLYEKKVAIVCGTVFAIALMSVAELLVIYPAGGRCLFITYALFGFIFIYLLKNTKMDSERVKITMMTVGVVFTVLAVGIHTYHYAAAGKVNAARLDYVEQQMEKGERTIEIIELPYESWLHYPNNSSGVYFGNFFNYGNPDEMEFVFISYDDYLAKQK